jgi:hypothetical protein
MPFSTICGLASKIWGVSEMISTFPHPQFPTNRSLIVWLWKIDHADRHSLNYDINLSIIWDFFKFPMSGRKIKPQSPLFVHHRSNDCGILVSQYDRSLSFWRQLLVSSFRNDSEDFSIVPHHPLSLLSNEARGKRARFSSLLKYFCNPRQEAALKNLTSWGKITVCHLERWEKIRCSVEALSGQCHINGFSIDWEVRYRFRFSFKSIE